MEWLLAKIRTYRPIERDAQQVPKQHSLMNRDALQRTSSTNFSQRCVHFIGRNERSVCLVAP